MVEPGEIDKLFVDLETRLVKFKQEFAMEFQQRLENHTPVRTGALKAGWVTQLSQTGFKLSNIQPYAAYVEYGTEKMAPRAMIGTTLLEKDQIVKVVKDKLGLK